MKCQDCKYWTGKQVTIGRECTNPKKQKMWKAKEELYTAMGYRNPLVNAKYKYASAHACKEFQIKLHGYRIQIEPCYMVSLVSDEGEIVKSEISMGKKPKAHALGEKMLMEVSKSVGGKV